MIPLNLGVNKERFLKIICVLTILISIIIYKITQKHLKAVQIHSCIKDSAHLILSLLNKILHHSSFVKVVLFGTFQLLIDLVCIGTFILWFFKVKNFRLPATLSLYFITRTVVLCIYKFQSSYSQNTIWQSPGFPSLLVSYSKAPQYIISTYSGAMTIFTMQLYELRYKAAATISFIGLIYIIFILLASHVNTISDIVSSVIFAYFYYEVVKKYLKMVDYIFSFPLIIVKYILTMCKRSQYVQPVKYYDDVATD